MVVLCYLCSLGSLNKDRLADLYSRSTCEESEQRCFLMFLMYQRCFHFTRSTTTCVSTHTVSYTVPTRGGVGKTGANYRGPDCAAYGYVFLGSVVCLLNKLTVSDSDQVTLQLDVSLSDLV